MEGSTGDVVWLGDSGASRHVCNDMSLLWDVKVREDPIILRRISGKLEVYVTGTIKLECMDKEGVPVILQLYNTLYIPPGKGVSFQPSENASGTLQGGSEKQDRN